MPPAGLPRRIKKSPGGQVRVGWKGRALNKIQFCSRSRKTKILTTGIYGIFRGLKFESDAVIGQKGMFFKALKGSK